MNTLDELVRRIVAGEVERQLAARPAPQVTDPNRLTGSSGVAAMLDISRRAFQERLQRARRAGEMQPLERLSFEIDGVRRWRVIDVERFIAEKAAK